MRKKHIRIKKWIILIVVLLFAIIVNVAEAKEKGKPSISNKTVQGEISAIGKNYISIIYQREKEKGTEYEIWLPLKKEDIKLLHKKSLEDLKVGDIVKIEFEEVTEESKKGIRSTRKVKVINFIKPAIARPKLFLKGVK